MSAAFAAAGGAGAADAPRPVVVEMFLSQSCPQSPPAGEYMTALAARPDVVAIAWHVDYWDHLIAKKFGAWADIFAAPEFAARQKAYNKRIRGRGVVFTPQAVIDGVRSEVGSKRAVVESGIVSARAADEKSPAPALWFEKGEAGQRNSIRVQIDKVGVPYDVYVVRFRKAAATKITGGDNAGIVFREANVATGVEELAAGHSGAGAFRFEPPSGEGMGCAVIVQERGQGRIVAARYCSS